MNISGEFSKPNSVPLLRTNMNDKFTLDQFVKN